MLIMINCFKSDSERKKNIDHNGWSLLIRLNILFWVNLNIRKQKKIEKINDPPDDKLQWNCKLRVVEFKIVEITQISATAFDYSFWWCFLQCLNQDFYLIAIAFSLVCLKHVQVHFTMCMCIYYELSSDFYSFSCHSCCTTNTWANK